MTEIEKMKRYIERTNTPSDPSNAYGFCLGELQEIGEFAKADLFHALCLLFEYGKAKGYRAAKAEKKLKEAI